MRLCWCSVGMGRINCCRILGITKKGNEQNDKNEGDGNGHPNCGFDSVRHD